MSADPNRVQLRLRYDLPATPQRLQVALRGLHVSIHPEDGDLQRTGAYLQGVGVPARPDSVEGFVVPVADLPLLRSLPARVTLLPDPVVAVLLRLLTSSTTSVVVTLDTATTANLNWLDETGECNEAFPVSDMSALLALGVPLAASPRTWEQIQRASALPIVRARARVNLDGFVEVVTPVPQQLAHLEIPGLFVLDDNRFGVPMVSAAHLDHVPGLVWDGPHPSAGTASPSVPEVFTPSWRSALSTLDPTSSLRPGRILVGGSRTTRSLLAVWAALCNDALPLLILCRPASLWVWHLQVRSAWTVFPSAASEILVVSYDGFEPGDGFAAGCVVFDDPVSACATDPDLYRRLHLLDGNVDGMRLATVQHLPESSSELSALASLVRPVEFSADLPAAARYAPPPEQRLRDHVAVYTQESPSGAPSPLSPDGPTFTLTDLEVVDPGSVLREALDRLEPLPPDRLRARREQVESVKDLLSSGTDRLLSPKLGRVLAITTDEVRAGGRVLLLSERPRTRERLSVLLGALPPSSVYISSPTEAGVARGVHYDAVVVVDAGISTGEIEAIVAALRPARVVRVHVDHVFEDRFALLGQECKDPESTEYVDVVLDGQSPKERSVSRYAPSSGHPGTRSPD